MKLILISLSLTLIALNVYCTSASSITSSISEALRDRRSVIHNIAVDRMLRDRGFVISVIDCVLDKAPCDKHGRHLKRLVPEVLRGHCPGCDRNVKTQVRRVITHVQRNFPQQWSEVMNRFINSVQNPSQSVQNFFG